ncbi:MAG: fibronectin type III domain-containing protein [Planctomycetes bacterium]|nr:fibronectin type III domain-containing protein [Planctomycetota bacterium]
MIRQKSAKREMFFSLLRPPQRHAARGAYRHSTKLRIEPLEARRLLAVVDLTAAGVLTYTGDADVNQLTISVAGDVYTLIPGPLEVISVNNDDSGTAMGGGMAGVPLTIGMVAADITSIQVNMETNNDSVTVASSDDPLGFDGGDGDDTLIGPDAASTWAINAANGGNLAGSVTVSFSDVENVTGGTGTDDFTFANAGSLTGAVDGGAGTDTLIGDDDGNVFTVTAANEGTLAGKTSGFSNVENLTGGAATDDFTITAAGSLTGSIDGGSGGANSLTNAGAGNTWTISGANSGTVTDLGTGFSNIASLTGGVGEDDFTITAAGSLTGSIDGGSGGANSLTNAGAGNTWTISGANAGSVTDVGTGFSNIASLTGGSAEDDFTITAAGSLTGSIDGGSGGANSLTNAGPGNTWTISGANAGSVTDLGTGFSNIASLTGGIGTDLFTFQDSFGVTGNVDGGLGQDRLDYSQYTTTKNILLTSIGTADGYQGEETANPMGIGGTFDNINQITGGMAGNDELTGLDTVNDWVIDEENTLGDSYTSTVSMRVLAFEDFEILNGRDQVDTFRVVSTVDDGRPRTLNAAGDNDAFIFSSDVSNPALGSLDKINERVTVDGGANGAGMRDVIAGGDVDGATPPAVYTSGSMFEPFSAAHPGVGMTKEIGDTLSLHDGGDSDSNQYVINASAFIRTSASMVRVDHTTIETLNLFGGMQHDEIVLITDPPLPDVVLVHGGTGADNCMRIEGSDQVEHLTIGNIAPGPSPRSNIEVANIQDLRVNAGGGDDVVHDARSGPGTRRSVIDGGAGDDILVVDSGDSVALFGGAGRDFLRAGGSGVLLPDHDAQLNPVVSDGEFILATGGNFSVASLGTDVFVGGITGKLFEENILEKDVISWLQASFETDISKILALVNQVDCSQPVAVSAPAMMTLSATATSIELSWNDSSGEDGYRVYQWNGVHGALIADLPANATSHLVLGLTPGTNYWFTLEAYNSSGLDWTPWTSTATLPAAPGSPDPLAIAPSDTQVSLTWNDAGNQDGYRVYQWNGSHGVEIAALPADASGHVVSGLSPNTSYFFSIEAFNVSGSGWANWKNVTTLAAPAVPTSPAPITLAGATSTSLDIGWTASAFADGYRVFQWNGSQGVEIASLAASTISLSIGSLAPNTGYWFSVEAFNSSGSRYAPWTTFTTLAASDPLPAAAPSAEGKSRRASRSAQDLDGIDAIESVEGDDVLLARAVDAVFSRGTQFDPAENRIEDIIRRLETEALEGDQTKDAYEEAVDELRS